MFGDDDIECDDDYLLTSASAVGIREEPEEASHGRHLGDGKGDNVRTLSKQYK